MDCRIPRTLRFKVCAGKQHIEYNQIASVKASSRHQLRYMVDGGPAARNQARIASEKHLPALNSDIWLSAGSAPNLE